MNPYLLTALISAILAFGSGWQIQSWRYGALENDRAETNLESERLAGRARTAAETRVVVAQSAAATRAVAARADAAGVRGELERVRALSDAAIAAASVSHAACVDRAAALSDVFKSCAGRYSWLAEKADGHASDIETLNAAWPVSP